MKDLLQVGGKRLRQASGVEAELGMAVHLSDLETLARLPEVVAEFGGNALESAAVRVAATVQDHRLCR